MFLHTVCIPQQSLQIWVMKGLTHEVSQNLFWNINTAIFIKVPRFKIIIDQHCSRLSAVNADISKTSMTYRLLCESMKNKSVLIFPLIRVDSISFSVIGWIVVRNVEKHFVSSLEQKRAFPVVNTHFCLGQHSLIKSIEVK